MSRHLHTAMHTGRLAIAIVGAVALVSCGGGSDTEAAAASSNTTIIRYAANAVLITRDTANITNAGVLATQAMMAAGAGSGTSARACPSGGSATLSIIGGTPQGEASGMFEIGEVVQATFNACIGAAGYPQLDGTLGLTVQEASGDRTNGFVAHTMTATNLALNLPQGRLILNGAANRRADFQSAMSHVFTSTNMTLETQYSSHSSTFTLANLGIQSTTSFAAITPACLSCELDNTTVSGPQPPAGVNGGARYDERTGTPISGQWQLTLPTRSVVLAIANGTARIDADDPAFQTITMSVAQLISSGG